MRFLLSQWRLFGPNMDVDPSRYFKAEIRTNPMKLIDFMFLSVHRALPIGKDILQTYYNRQPIGAISKDAPAEDTRR